MRIFVYFFIYLSIFSIRSHATSVPDNTLQIPTNTFLKNDITQEDYDQIIDEAISPWSDIANQYQAKLVNERDWKSKWVYAAAEQRDNMWIIRIKGGLARHPYMTKDSLTLIACHELGHHFAGFPFAYSWVWFASEGQADYFSTQVCAKLIWKNKTEENKAFRSIVGQYVKSKCDQLWSTSDEQNLCYRIAHASYKLALFYAEVSRDPEPRFDTPDPNEVVNSDPNHPQAQCRLDTLFQGLICNTNFDLNFIPGLNSTDGRDSLEAEIQASKHSCMKRSKHIVGLRPNCWFKESPF